MKVYRLFPYFLLFLLFSPIIMSFHLTFAQREEQRLIDAAANSTRRIESNPETTSSVVFSPQPDSAHDNMPLNPHFHNSPHHPPAAVHGPSLTLDTTTTTTTTTDTTSRIITIPADLLPFITTADTLRLQHMSEPQQNRSLNIVRGQHALTSAAQGTGGNIEDIYDEHVENLTNNSNEANQRLIQYTFEHVDAGVQTEPEEVEDEEQTPSLIRIPTPVLIRPPSATFTYNQFRNWNNNEEQ